jgi:RimJ/RimL family protein N-acetyltransferase
MTSTVTIRRATAVDAEFLLAVRAEPSASRYQPLWEYSLERLRSILQQRANDPLDRTFSAKAQWVIEHAGSPSGWITLDAASREHGVASVGYTVSEAFQGRGVASGALELVIEIAFDPGRLDLSRLEAVAAVGNVASRRVLTRAGFREEGIAVGLLVIDGIRVDHVRFGLVRR